MTINTKVISRYFEGVKLAGYVPPLDGGPVESGVTIASGLDLGQHTVAEIEQLPAVLAFRLSKYCGVTGQAAVDLLKREPLTVTQAECDIICDFAHKRAEAALLREWRKDTKQDFYSLPDEMQTVIASVAFQYGASLRTRCPMFWRQAIANDWDGMARNLWDFKDPFEPRRRTERGLLIWGMTKWIG